MNRNNQDELITDIYRAKLVYEAEMKSPEYRAEGEEDFEFIGKALAAKGYRKASDVAREVLALVWDAYQTTHYDAEFEERLDRIEEKYTEGCDG